MDIEAGTIEVSRRRESIMFTVRILIFVAYMCGNTVGVIIGWNASDPVAVPLSLSIIACYYLMMRDNYNRVYSYVYGDEE